MGYSTDFNGRFKLDRTLTPAHAAYLTKFAETRRMRRDEKTTETRSDPIREAAGLQVGAEGEYFVGEGGLSGQGDDCIPYGERGVKLGILSFNDSPGTQPGLWCQWTPSTCGNYIEWDGGEKFYNFVDWLAYICDNFLTPWGYTLNGEVAYHGEDHEDRGRIYCVANRVKLGVSPLEQLAGALASWERADPDELCSPYCTMEDEEF